MINKDLYPTPLEVYQTMVAGVDLGNSYILDPSAGFGYLLDYSKPYTNNLYAYEIEDKLISIIKDKEYRLLGTDFLKSTNSDIPFITHIIMNPPFSKDVDHITHAWDIAPEGCTIIALCNWESIDNTYAFKRQHLKNLIKNHGSVENIGQVFMDAERTTDVEVGLIKLYKPVISSNFDYSIFFTDEEDEEESMGTGLMSYNEIRSIVNNYVGVIKEFDKISESINYINNNSKTFGNSQISINFSQENKFTSKETFVLELQKRSWDYIFDRLNMRKYLTTKLLDQINKFIVVQKNIPFTMKNISVMLDMVFQTRYQSLQTALVESIDNFTKYTDKNRYSLPGWKTNLGHMLNRRIIIDNVIDTLYTRNVKYGTTSTNYIDDLIKVMCNLFGENYDNIKHVSRWVNKETDFGVWHNVMINKGNEKEPLYEAIFFEFKIFKKGTMHLKFSNENQWKKINETYGKIKGFTLHEN